MKKLQNQEGVAPIVLVIVLAIIASTGYGAYQSFHQKSASLPTIPLVKPLKEPLEINFTETGNILNWDSRSESYTENWTLLYEKPGNPAISVKLVFNEASFCDLGEGRQICDKNKLNNGDRAKVEGNRNNEEVVVINLTRL